MAVTSVDFKHYVLGHLGMIPDATLFCLVGASIASLSKLNDTGIGSNETVLIITIVLTIIAVIGIIYIGIRSKQELMKIAEIAKRNNLHLHGSNMQLKVDMEMDEDDKQQNMKNQGSDYADDQLMIDVPLS